MPRFFPDILFVWNTFDEIYLLIFAGAIKFGDSLTMAECSQLVASLAACALPFQCAHGRPTCQPLLPLSAVRALEKERAEVRAAQYFPRAI